MIALAFLFALSADDGLATDKDYDITSQAEVQNKHGTLSLKITPKNGFHVSAETPLSVALKSDLALPASVGRKELVEGSAPAPAWKIAFEPKPGAHDVKANFVFFLCSDKLCQRMTAQRTISVQ